METQLFKKRKVRVSNENVPTTLPTTLDSYDYEQVMSRDEALRQRIKNWFLFAITSAVIGYGIYRLIITW